MKSYKIAALFIGMLNLSFSVDAFVYGYTKLYRGRTQTTVDLLYDVHIGVPHITIHDFFKLDLNYAKRKLYPTEQKCCDFLQEWGKDCRRMDLIWEASTCDYEYSTPRTPCFIGLAPFFKFDKISFICFISADRYRRTGFTSLFSITENGEKVTDPNLIGCTFENPAPLELTTIAAIKRSSGFSTWLNYKAFYDKTVGDLKDYFRPFYYGRHVLEYQKHFTQNNLYHAMCDIEILSHILASNAKRVVVYAGGWHCENIAKFLKNNDFIVLSSKVSSHAKELDARELNILKV
ncbi:hypothetical protein H0X06_05365 [Candidatus Dependentiae bacterium]|nr:hypothetical protein [Candidatus Dependentiae bacterium]